MRPSTPSPPIALVAAISCERSSTSIARSVFAGSLHAADIHDEMPPSPSNRDDGFGDTGSGTAERVSSGTNDERPPPLCL
jgi:hypothetical protein